MTTPQLLVKKFVPAAVAVLAIVGLGGCIYEIPVTTEPTRPVEQQLLGDWISRDGKNRMKVRRLDQSRYVVSVNGYLFLAHHSDVASHAFASLQEIETPARKYAYVAWSLSADAGDLRWRALSRKVIPQDIHDPAAVRALLERNLENPALYEAEQQYTREK